MQHNIYLSFCVVLHTEVVLTQSAASSRGFSNKTLTEVEIKELCYERPSWKEVNYAVEDQVLAGFEQSIMWRMSHGIILL